MFLAISVLAGCSAESDLHGQAETQTSEASNSSVVVRSVADNGTSRDAVVSGLGIVEPYTEQLTSLSQINIQDAQLERALAAIEYPWALEFVNKNEILLTQNNGTLLQINLSSEERFAIGGLPK